MLAMRAILTAATGEERRPSRLCGDQFEGEAMHPTDVDPQETREWLDALDAVVANDGLQRAQQLVESVIDRARRVGAPPPDQGPTPYVNTIPPSLEAPFSGDLVFIQGHSSPGIYARAYLEGRISEEQLKRFRQELDEKGRFDSSGLASYPHPWLMPEFWQFPTVSMGLGPIMAIYQARFLKYLHARGLANTANRKVWAFLGDGETDEPESLGGISLAAREKLDNLIFVINCNLQRLDGPVRGNGKIIQ